MRSVRFATVWRTSVKLLLALAIIAINLNVVFGLMSLTHQLKPSTHSQPVPLVTDHYNSLTNDSLARYLTRYSSTVEDFGRYFSLAEGSGVYSSSAEARDNSSAVIIRNFNEKLSNNLGEFECRRSTDLSLISQQIIMLLVVKIILLWSRRDTRRRWEVIWQNL